MKKNWKNQGHIVDFFFTLSLFCLFAASALIVVIIGSGVYRNTTVQMEENYVARTALSYVAEKVRQHDRRRPPDRRGRRDSACASEYREYYRY